MPSLDATAVLCSIPQDAISVVTKASFKNRLRKTEFKFQSINSPKNDTLMMSRKLKPAKHYNEIGESELTKKTGLDRLS
jgi:hypothetical protein